MNSFPLVFLSFRKSHIFFLYTGILFILFCSHIFVTSSGFILDMDFFVRCMLLISVSNLISVSSKGYVIQGTYHTRDVSYKGIIVQEQIVGDTLVGDTSSWHPSSPYSSFQAPCSSFCLFLLPLAPSRPFQLLFVTSSLILIL